MKAKFTAEKPQDVDFRIEFTMSLSEWEAISNQLDSAYPAWQFASMIKTVVNKAKQTYYADGEEVTPYDR